MGYETRSQAQHVIMKPMRWHATCSSNPNLYSVTLEHQALETRSAKSHLWPTLPLWYLNPPLRNLAPRAHCCNKLFLSGILTLRSNFPVRSVCHLRSLMMHSHHRDTADAIISTCSRLTLLGNPTVSCSDELRGAQHTSSSDRFREGRLLGPAKGSLCRGEVVPDESCETAVPGALAPCVHH